MVSRCNKVRVKIYADAVFNHIAAGSRTGFNGTKFGNRAIPGICITSQGNSLSSSNLSNLSSSNLTSNNLRWRTRRCSSMQLDRLQREEEFRQQLMLDVEQQLQSQEGEAQVQHPPDNSHAALDQLIDQLGLESEPEEHVEEQADTPPAPRRRAAKRCRTAEKLSDVILLVTSRIGRESENQISKLEK